MLVARSLGFALVLLVMASAALADVVPNMYSAQVPVANQSSSELAGASRLALSEVLVKVSGSVAVLENPIIVTALANARSQVQRYSYSKDPDSPDGLLVTQVFDSAYVTDLVIEAGAPLWTANRPLVLVWLTMESAGQRQFVNQDTQGSLVASLQVEFARRGVPLQLPLYDLIDAAALSPDQAWRLDGPTLERASSRYGLPDVLAGRFSRLPSGGIAGEWIYHFGDNRIQRSVKVDDEQLFLREGVALVAEAMAARYAVAATASGGGLVMSVSGVEGYADYAAIIVWLESLELVESANVEFIGGNIITLRLGAKTDASQLAGIIKLNERLVPSLVAAPGAQLSYQWQR